MTKLLRWLRSTRCSTATTAAVVAQWVKKSHHPSVQQPLQPPIITWILIMLPTVRIQDVPSRSTLGFPMASGLNRYVTHSFLIGESRNLHHSSPVILIFKNILGDFEEGKQVIFVTTKCQILNISRQSWRCTKKKIIFIIRKCRLHFIPPQNFSTFEMHRAHPLTYQ